MKQTISLSLYTSLVACCKIFRTLISFPLLLQAYVDAVLDLASHFITRLRRYASFCRTLASHAASAGTGSNRNIGTSPTQNASSPATTQGQYAIDFFMSNLLQHDKRGFEWYIAVEIFIPLRVGDDTNHRFCPRIYEYEMSF